MACKLCGQPANLLAQFKPYTDMPWEFEVYQCDTCLTRYAVRDENINYHEAIHNNRDTSTYSQHYLLAEKIKKLLNAKQLDSCEKILNEFYKFREILTFLKTLPTHLKILEVGCSSGFMTALLRAKGHEAYGVDIAASAVEYANRTFGRYYSTQPATKSKYDVIFHCGLIGCVGEPKAFIESYLVLLSDNGTMIFNAPNGESIIRTDALWVSTPPPDLIYLFSDKSFQYIIPIDKYQWTVSRAYDYRAMITKYIKLMLNRPSYKYPRKFICAPPVNPAGDIVAGPKKYVLNIAAKVFRLFVDFGLINKLEEEYGLIVRINKRT